VTAPAISEQSDGVEVLIEQLYDLPNEQMEF
jgi:hypothetical protein